MTGQILVDERSRRNGSSTTLCALIDTSNIPDPIDSSTNTDKRARRDKGIGSISNTATVLQNDLLSLLSQHKLYANARKHVRNTTTYAG
jgi:hypothetical protein